MRCAAAVGVDDDLSAGQAGVALRSANDEAAGRVYIILSVLVKQLCGDAWLDDEVYHIVSYLLKLCLGSMLGREDNGVNSHRLACIVILDGDLSFAVRTQVIDKALLSDIGKALCDLVRQADGKWHELGGLVAGVAEHHALVARSVLKLGILTVFHLKRLVNAESNIRRLLVDVGDDAAGLAVKAVLCSVIADLADNIAGYLGNVDVAVGAYLAHDVDKTGGHGGLTGDTTLGVLFQNCVKDSVGDLVADLIGMSLGHGFGCKQSFAHFSFPPKFLPNTLLVITTKKSVVTDGFCFLVIASSLDNHRRIWHHALRRLPGFTGPFPPPLLIRCSVFV